MLSWPLFLDAAGTHRPFDSPLASPPHPPRDDTYGWRLESEITQTTVAGVPRPNQVDLELTADDQSRDRRSKQQHQQLVIESHGQTPFPPQGISRGVSQEPFHSAVKGCACFSRDDPGARPERERERSHYAYCHAGQSEGCAGLRAAEEAESENSCIVSRQHPRWSSRAPERRAAQKRATGKILVHSGHARLEPYWEMEANLDGHMDAGPDPMAGRPKEEGKRKINVNVKERIKAIEEKGSPTEPGSSLRNTKSLAVVGNTDGPGPDDPSSANERGGERAHGVPLVFPLHVKRFHRRRSNGSPLRPETPLYRSDPGQETDIQSPLPQRTIPVMRAPSEASIVSQSILPSALTPTLSPAPAILQDVGRSLLGGSRTPAAAPNQAHGNVKEVRSTNSLHPKAAAFQSKARVNPFAHFHGTRTACVRHGRKSGLGKNKSSHQKATKNMLEKGRSGAYIPVGLSSIKQMEATSPWAFPNSATRCTELTCLTTEANQTDEDACPDCVAELGIKRREMEKAVSDWSDTALPVPKDKNAIPPTTEVKTVTANQLLPPSASAQQPTATPEDRAMRQPSWRSTAVEPPDSEGEDDLVTASSTSMRSAISSTAEAIVPDSSSTGSRKRSRYVRFDSFSQVIDDVGDSRQLIISRDLGDGLDAVIIERGGRVEKVITNANDRGATPELIARISRELAQISSTLSSNSFNNQSTSDVDEDEEEVEDTGRTGVVDRNSDPGAAISSMDSSVPELLQLINDAAKDLQPGLIRKPAWERVSNSHAWLDETSAKDLAAAFGRAFTPLPEEATQDTADRLPIPPPSERIVSHQRLDADYRTLDLMLTKIQHEQNLSSLQNTQPTSRPTTPLTTSTCYASRPSSNPTQNLISTPVISPMEPTLPSHLLQSKDFPSSPSPQPSLGSPLMIPNIRLQSSSPCIFTPSTAPSLTVSVANSAQPSPEVEGPTTPGMQAPRTPEMRMGMGKLWGSPSEVKANSQTIRQGMRMERMGAVQEAAAVEREGRRRRLVGE